MEAQDATRFFDLGHQGDFDWTQIEACLKLTPTERIRRHEPWRLFVKEALARANVRRDNEQPASRSEADGEA